MRTTTSMLARCVGFLSLLPALQACSSEAVGTSHEPLRRSSAALVEKHTWVKVHDGTTPIRPLPRMYSATAYDPSNKVTWVYAGHDYPAQSTYVDLWSWDGHLWKKHEQGGNRPSIRGFPTGTYDEKRNVFVLAGGVGPGLDYRNDVWTWDGTSWTELPEKMIIGRGNCHSVYDPGKDLLLLPAGLAGGTINQTTSVRKGLNWDLPSYKFPTERLGFALVYDPIRKIVLLDGGSIASTDSLFWNDIAETWDPLPTNLKTFRYGHRIVFDSDRNRLIMSGSRSGGSDSSSVDANFYEWDGAAWNIIPSAHPPYRTEASMTYDRARKRVVYFGGAPTSTTAPFNDTWEYDPAVQAWAEVNVVPTVTNRPAAAYDEARKRSVVLTNDSTETWLWDGRSWAHALPRTTEHPKAISLAMAYDPIRKQVVTFGGHDGVKFSNETWLWDGGDWKKVEGLSEKPSARNEHVMAWHPGRQVIVMTGGSGEGSTWEWNGTAWTETIPGDFPGHIDAGHMATDHANNTVTIAGGGACGTHHYKILQNPPPKATWDTVVDGCAASTKYAASAADPYRQRIIHQGLQKTVEWDGSAWQDTSPATMPTADILAAMTFDKEANKAFLFLGRKEPVTLVNEVWAYETVLSGCSVDGDCPDGLVCNNLSECVPGQGGSGGAGQGGSSGSSGQSGAGQGGSSGAAGQGGVSGSSGQGGAGQGGSSGAGQGGLSGASGHSGSGGSAGAPGGIGGDAGAGGSDAGVGGDSGAGGSDAGAGGDAASGAGGAGQGGTEQGGAGGAAGGGAGQGGTGEAGNGGAGAAGGNAGQGGSAGAAGQGGAGAGGSGQGGASGSSGQSGAGQGGAGQGGSGAGQGGLSGSSGQGGSGVLPSSSRLFGAGAPDDAGSCGCRVAPVPTPPSALAAWVPALAWLLRRRGRRDLR